MIFKYNLPGHEKNPEVCCCGEAPDLCLPYIPCCLRDFRAQFGALVTEVDPDFPDDPDSGDLSSAFISEFKIENNCNSQMSVDWSSWQRVNSSSEGGQVNVMIAGAGFQGCTFGIDVEPEHLFCECGNYNFEWRVKFANPQDVPIRVRLSQPALTFSYAGATLGGSCTLPTSQEDVELIIDPCEEGEYIKRFRKADLSGCIDHCYKNGPRAILEDIQYFPTDPYDYTCLEPIVCTGEDSSIVFVGEAIDSCDYPLCPPCGCVLDDNCPTCCSCGCDGVEAMNSCAPPKMLCGCSEDSGTITLCESFNQGFGAGEQLLICLDNCYRVTAQIGRLLAGSSSWLYRRSGNPGASVSLDMAGLERNCEDFDVSWSIAGGFITLTIDGNSNSNPLPIGYDPLPAGTCWITADKGSRFTVK